MSGILTVCKLRLNLKQCAWAVKMTTSAFTSLAAFSVYNHLES